MKFKPHGYQERAIKFVLDNPYCCLLLDMGLGKTVSTLTAISELIDCCDVRKVLVVAPKKVAESTWSTERDKWDHLSHLKISVVLGTAKQRTEALERAADIYVTSRDNITWVVDNTKKWDFDMIVLDELTSFKNSKSQRWKSIKKIRPKTSRVVGLTGTPIPNGLKDLWGQIYCIDMGARLGMSKTRFLDTYFNVFRRDNIPIKCDLRPGADKVMLKKIEDICITMKAKDYLELPAILEQTLEVTLPAKISAKYKEFERDNVLEISAKIDAAETPAIIASNAAALMNKLMQFANGAVYTEEQQYEVIHDEKMDVLMELIEQANAGGESVLVFYQFQHDYHRALERKELKGLRVRKYESSKDLDDWNAGKVDVMFTHAASTAYGLNLQQGGHVIAWYGTGFNAELFLQGNARLHRQGQTCVTRIYKIVVKDTIDEDAANAVDGKVASQDAMLEALTKRMKALCI